MRPVLPIACVVIAAAVPLPAPAATRTFHITGQTANEMCPAVGATERCIEVTPGDGTPWRLPTAGRYQSIAFTASYDQIPGGIADMYVALERLVGGVWESQWHNGHVAVATGSSLSVSWTLSGYPAGSALRLAFHTGSDRMIAGTVFFYTGFARSFTVNGSVVFT